MTERRACCWVSGGVTWPGRTPVFWMHQVEYLWLCVVTSGVVFLLRKPVTKLMGSNAFRCVFSYHAATGAALPRLCVALWW